MRLISHNFEDGADFPAEFAFATTHPTHHISLSADRNPHLAWSGIPAGTKSLALICHDPDVPSRLDSLNKEGDELPAAVPRVTFYHWLLLDIPPAMREIAAGSQSNGIVPKGKAGPEAPGGLRHGVNDFTKWFANDAEMAGDYYGYDGPCPPWNDALPHHYIFTLYALDTPCLEIDGPLNGENVEASLEAHVLAQASLTGVYSLNPTLHRN
ncbi:MAG: YbhB/YbcL family Raf kinase inhibitor-like protein [Hyphomicrobiales bacterium]|nr:YbhB/YbcL family Raf kinase inhibitor-like protein [Hyphomicrobiales bacterium]MBV8663079.1 YbhB/YbcL family Raf kinase inhibitor-like protein [Hyphomicrobiales bacterium]